jgi:hypothetical protein
LKNGVEFVYVVPGRSSRTRAGRAGEAAARATICAADALMVIGFPVGVSPATAGNGTSDVMATSPMTRVMCVHTLLTLTLIEILLPNHPHVLDEQQTRHRLSAREYINKITSRQDQSRDECRKLSH